VTRSPIPRWAAALVVAVAASAAAPAAVGAPTISPDAESWNAAQVPVSYTITPSEGRARVWWAVLTSRFDPVQSGTGGDVRLPEIGDGEYQLWAYEAGGGLPEGITIRHFRVDTIAPFVAVRAPIEGASYRVGQAATVDFSCDVPVCVGSQPSGGPLSTALPGVHALEVTAMDAAGNVTRVRRVYRVLEALAPVPPPPVAPAPAAQAPAAPAATARRPRVAARVRPPQTTNARRLRPRRGAVVRTTRPVLRWRARKGARFYNVQVFRLAGRRYVKVLSAFPRTNRLRMPARRLRPGARHVWRVWPMVGRSFTRKPLGVSYFEVRERPRRPRGATRGR